MQKTRLFDPLTLGAPEPVKTITLRPYQEEARDAIFTAWDRFVTDTIAVLSTGTGKTEIYLSVLEKAIKRNPKARAIVIAHRQELIYQPRDRILHHWPTLQDVGVVMAGENQCGAQIVIATIQTLAANGRLDQIMARGKITHVVTDEAHHSVAPTYLGVYERLREHNPDLLHLGVTATPKRTDGDGLSRVYQSVAFKQGIKKSIKLGALSPFVALGFQLPVNISQVRQVGSGWDDDELGDVLKARNAEDLIVEKWKEHSENKPTIAFTASVAQAYSLAERFTEAGYAFEAADGTTKQDDRRAILRRFKSGETVGLCNCALFTEGFDSPKIQTLVQVRPTRSDLVYMQMLGRALRRHPSKQSALIMDFVPEGARDLLMAGDMLGKPKEQREAEEKAEKDDIILAAFGIDSKGEGVDGDPDQIVIQVLDYLTSSALAWLFDGRLASASFGDDGTLAIVMPDDKALARLQKADELKTDKALWPEEWDVEYTLLLGRIKFRLYHIQRYMPPKLLGAFDTWEDASEAANDHCGESNIGILGKKSSRWRKRPVSVRQEALCKRHGTWEPGMTQGRASRAIAHYFAKKELKLL